MPRAFLRALHIFIPNTAAGLPRSFRPTFDIVVGTIGGSGLGDDYNKTEIISFGTSAGITLFDALMARLGVGRGD